MPLLFNKHILITGMLTKQSIAYGIAQAMHREGAILAFTYQSSRIKDMVTKLAQEFDSDLIFECDVSSDTQIDQMFNNLKTHWSNLDAIVHSIAFTTGDAFGDGFVNHITRENFRIAHDISSYSFAALAKQGLSLLSPTASLLAISYLGAERTAGNYNVMGLAKASLESNVRYLANDLGPRGVRVNAISAGPHKTFATIGSTTINKSLEHYRTHSPLRRNINILEIGNAAAFLSSDLASAITGEITYVDGGYNIVGVSFNE